MLILCILVWNMELNVKSSLRYSKTGMIHDNYMKLEEFNYTGWDQWRCYKKTTSGGGACGLSGQYNSFKLIQNESLVLWS